MDPQDDPEARIRELERPLTDQARMSELGAAQPRGSFYPPTPPSAAYGAPFATTPLRTTTGFRGWWIVLAVFALGVMVLAAGVAVYGAHLFSSGSSIVGSPSSRPGTSSSAAQAPTTGGSTATAPPGGKLSVSGISKNETIRCNNSIVSVSGFSNTVVITGHCASLTVSGGENVVTVDSADNINASGFNNQVTFHSGSPQVGNFGESNVVQQG